MSTGAGIAGRLQGFGQSIATVWFFGILAMVPALYLFYQQNYSLLIGLMAVGTIIVIWQTSREIALVSMFTFLLFLGDIRRITDTVTGPRPLDLFLLIGPIFTIYVTLPLLLRLKLPDALSKAVLGFIALMCLEIFNPRQGPIFVGISGAMFWVIPVLWFWIGRWLGSERLLSLALYRVFLPIGVLDALLGIFQTTFGFFSWEEAWARPLAGQYILSGGRVRPFGFSSSGIEYSLTILAATALTFAAIFAGRKIYALALPILLPALLLSSSRGSIIRALFAIAMIWAVRSGTPRVWLPRLVFAVTLGFALLTYSAATVAPEEDLSSLKKSTSAEYATAHVTQGLAHPLDAKYSTGGIHTAMVLNGIRQGFTYPVGAGIGSVTLAAVKFGGDSSISGSTEVDISDTFAALGLVGGLLYLFIIYRSLANALLYLRFGSKMNSLGVVGLLAAMLGTWVPPSYCIGPIIWLCIGTLCVKVGQNASSSKASAPRAIAPPSGAR